MRLDKRSIDLCGSQVHFSLRRIEDAIEDPSIGPAAEALVDGPPLAAIGRQVSPRRPRAHDPHDALYRLAVVGPGSAWVSRPTGQQGFDAFPLLVRDLFSDHAEASSRTARGLCSSTSNVDSCEHILRLLADDAGASHRARDLPCM